MVNKEKRYRHMTLVGTKYKSPVMKFRERYLRQGFELVDITQLCQLKLGRSGWCNDFNEPDDEIYHIQIWYRDENIACIGPEKGYAIDDGKYVLFITNKDDICGADFILFKKCPLIKEKKNGRK